MNDEFNQKTDAEADWEMSEAKNNLPPNQRVLEPIEDWSMTGKLVPPKQNAAGSWKMPEPKFQATSGSLPPDHAKNLPDDSEAVTEPLEWNGNLDLADIEQAFAKQNGAAPAQIKPANDPVFDAPPPEPVPEPVAIEEQPDIAEAFAAAAPVEIEKPPEPKQRSRAVKIFLTVFGLTAMLFFAVGFLVLVYFLFFYKPVVE